MKVANTPYAVFFPASVKLALFAVPQVKAENHQAPPTAQYYNQALSIQYSHTTRPHPRHSIITRPYLYSTVTPPGPTHDTVL